MIQIQLSPISDTVVNKHKLLLGNNKVLHKYNLTIYGTLSLNNNINVSEFSTRNQLVTLG
jgi:hypothetical protein